MKLTKGEIAFLEELEREGFVMHRVTFGRSQRNRCGWSLVNKGLATFDFGPRGSFLKVQGFMPVTKESENA
jgi:hypothetical protein